MNNTRSFVVFGTLCVAAIASCQRAWAGAGRGLSATSQIDTVLGGTSCDISPVFMLNNILPNLSCAVSAAFAVTVPDTDMDGYADGLDNCPDHPNVQQEDCDQDGVGDVCAIATGLSEDLNANALPDDCESCGSVADCADLDENLTRDDNCVWWNCAAGTCDGVEVIFGDMGGAFGACPPDGFASLFDRSHALTCFAGTNPCAALNIDAGGAFGSCLPDGFCNLFDATHALLAFAGTNPCTCPSNPAPAHEPVVVGQAGLTLVAEGIEAHSIVDRGPGYTDDQAPHVGHRLRTLDTDATEAHPDQIVRVQAFMNEAMPDLQSYQLHLSTTGGKSGRLELVDILIEPHPRAIFDPAVSGYEAFNTAKGQMLRGLDAGGVATSDKAYLATFIYKASRDASGTFVVDLLHNEAVDDQTFLVSDFTKKVEVVATRPAVIIVH